MINEIMNAIKTTLVIENKESLNICRDKIIKVLSVLEHETPKVITNEDKKELLYDFIGFCVNRGDIIGSKGLAQKVLTKIFLKSYNNGLSAPSKGHL